MGCAGRALRPYRVRKTLAPAVSGSLIRHDAEVATFASGLRAAGRRGHRARVAAPAGDSMTASRRAPLAAAVIAAVLLAGCGEAASPATQVSTTKTEPPPSSSPPASSITPAPASPQPGGPASPAPSGPASQPSGPPAA